MVSIREMRTAAKLSQGELARRADISRQALGAIEAGLYQPSVVVALGLARELGTTVEALFGGADAPQLSAKWVGDKSAAAPNPGAHVALARIDGKLIATPQPLSSLSLAPAAGVVGAARGRRVTVEAFRSRDQIDSTLLLAGCDPGVAILADWMTRNRSAAEVVAIPCSSAAALDALIEGRAHVAGVHLRDPRSGEYNLDPVRRRMGRRRATVVNFSSWEIGLAIHPRKRTAIRTVEDLAEPGIAIVNRERGSGARHALDEALAKAGIAGAKVRGYARELRGHLEVAAAIAAADADAGVSIRVAAEAYGLDFIAIREERYDFVIPEGEMELPAVRAMMDALNSARFSRELARLCAYDTRRTGSLIESN